MKSSGPILLRGKPLAPGAGPFIVGILNVTPDSFSDGGSYPTARDAIAAGMRMADEGADAIDVGGESSRPGSAGVPADEQIRRTQPIIAELAKSFGASGPAISIDTRSATVAAAALDAGASIVNDISALREDPALAVLVASREAGVILMHMQGSPADMQQSPMYGDVVPEVAEFLAERVRFAVAAGIARERIIIDPGIGFGKTADHNLQLLQRLDVLKRIGQPIMVGPSRKRFIGQVTGQPDPQQRVFGTAGAVAACVLAGVELIRVHDVAACRQAAQVAAAIARGRV